METTSSVKKLGSEGSGSDTSSGGGNSRHDGGVGGGRNVGDKEKGYFEYFGWVYHLGTNSIGHEYCHLRFLFIRGKYVEMYKRDPHENPGIKPIRRGVIGPTLMVEELGRRRFNHGDVYVMRLYNRLDESKKGEIACATAGEARKWMEAFDQAKQQAEVELSRGGSARNKLNMETEINLDGHRPRVRRYAHGLRKLIRIGHGPETLLRQSSDLGGSVRGEGFFEGDIGDAIEAHEWKCVRTLNGVRIFEDVADSKSGRGVLVKAVGVIDASADTVFEVVLNLERHQRYEWDMLTGDLELVDSYDGHYDVVYGTYDPKYLTRWQSKRDFVFSRQWFRGQDGTYTILQFPAVHKKRPPKSGYRRTKINPSTWEIRSLNLPMGSNGAKCLVTQMLEIHSSGWCRWKKNSSTKFEKTTHFALLSQVAGLKEYIGANPALKNESTTVVVHSKFSDVSSSNGYYEDVEVQEQFYDAIAADSSSSEDEDSDDSNDPDKKDKKVKLKNVSWAIASLALKRTSVPDANKEFDCSVPPIIIDPSQFHGSSHSHMSSPITHDLEITIICAKHLKNVNWRNGGDLKPYVVFYVDPAYRLATQSDDSGSTRPVWNERFTLPITHSVRESVLTLEIFHSKLSETPKPLVGSVKFPLVHLVDSDSSEPTQYVRKLEVLRPSGRPHGKIRVKLVLNERPLPPPSQDYQSAPDFGHYYYSAPPPPFPPPSRDYSYYPSYYTPQPPAPPRPLFGRASSYSLPSGSLSVPSAPVDFSPSQDYKQPPLPPQPRASGYGVPSGSGPSAPVDYSPYDQKLQKHLGGLSLEEEVNRKGKEKRAESEFTPRENYSYSEYRYDY